MLFFALLIWSRGRSIQEYTSTAPVSSRTEIVYIRGQLFELAVPRRAMSASYGQRSAVAAPVTLKLARSPAAAHVTAVDRPPEHRVGGAIYTRQMLLQLRSAATESLSESLLARLKQLGIGKAVGHRGA